MNWQDIDPKDAVDIDLTTRPDIVGPLNEMGEVCPWPWDPQQLVNVALGQYHCKYCGAMVMAGLPHPDYRWSAAMSEQPRARAASAWAAIRSSAATRGPVPTGGPIIQELVIADMRGRLALGIERYGTGLQVGNGRDMLQDAYDEALDLATYLRGLIEERKQKGHT